MTNASTVVFFDGVCGLCDRLVQFLIPRDRAGTLRFAPLQSELARAALRRHNLDPDDFDSVVVLTGWQQPSERAFTRSRAVLQTLAALGGGWRLLALAGNMIPRPLADVAYNRIARSRYRLFGRFDSCQLPRPEWRNRFLE